MKIIGDKFVLQAAFDKAYSLVGRSLNPVLSQAMLLADETGAHLIGSNGEQTLIVKMNDIVLEDPESCPLSKVVHDIIRSCEEGEVTLDISEQTVDISSAGAFWSVRREDAEYPLFDTDMEDSVTVSRDEMLEALRICRSALQSATIRPVFGFAHVKDGYMQSTDGSKFLRMPFDCPIEMLIPSDSLAGIQNRLRGMNSDEVYITETQKAYNFLFDEDMLIVTKHIADYPDLEERLVKATEVYEQFFSFDRDIVMDVVNRVSLTADPDTHYLNLAFTENHLVLSTQDRFGNRSTEEAEVYWPHADREIGVNWKFLMDTLTVYPDSEITVRIGEDQGPRLAYLRFDEASNGLLAILTRLASSLGLVSLQANQAAFMHAQTGQEEGEPAAVS